jgi:methyl-accepting chemotaxis protein
MQWLLDLSTRSKLFIGFGLLILFLAGTTFFAYSEIVALRGAQQFLYERDFANAVALKDMRSNQNANRTNVFTLLLVSDSAERQAVQQDIVNRTAEDDASLQALLADGQNDAQTTARLEEFAAIRTDHQQTLEEQVIPLILAGETAEAQVLILGIQADRNEQMRVIANELVAEADQRAQDNLDQSEERANNALALFVIVGVVAVLTGAGLALFLDRLIADPLKGIAASAEVIASGDLTVAVHSVKRADEVGNLAQSFRQMIESLRAVNRDIKEGVNVLAASSSEILAATTQVASGAAETATAVSETTTTVEEVKQTAQMALQKARFVADNTQRSTQASQAGRKATEDTIQGMNRIRAQMESIAESIVRLSEQGQSIGEIIASVNDLAEQSNVLAVNAAIEAAKAGEQGRGFSVVAQEVKSLAGQSKQATNQVRAILSDIQKATSAAVLATEQGSKAVEAGMKQTAEANEAIRQLTESLAEANQAATQIAASSQQQSVGMDQVALAMENIKLASNQNVAGTRQAEAAAQNLHELGQKLKTSVERFKA